jgi:small subunit ribosomal protein S1
MTSDPASQPTAPSPPQQSKPVGSDGDPPASHAAEHAGEHAAEVATAAEADDAAAPQAPPGVDGAAEAAELLAAKPSDRIRIGTQRPDAAAELLAAKPTAPAPAAEVAKPHTTSTPTPAKSYPPPNVRDKLSPEQEQELAAMLAGSSVDELMEQSVSSASTAELPPDTKVSGKVENIHGDDVFIDLGQRNQGVLPLKQLDAAPEIGAVLEVVVSRFDADQGLYDVSLATAAVDVGNWDEVQTGQVVEVSVSGANKGGLECQLAGIRGFIPMGQISIFRVENAEEYIGQRLTCVITEANRSRKNLVLSHRAFMERERKEKREKLLQELAPGQLREGVVRSLQDFGAFVDLGGVDGLVHVSQLSWDRVGHPSDVLQVGQQVKVRVEKVNPETGKISLGYRELTANPWEDAETRFAVGSNAKGSVTKLMQFGAFVRLGAGVEGLIHISELGHGRVHRVSDVLSEGQEVEVRVLSVDTQAQRIGLSLKALMPKPEAPQQASQPEPDDSSAEEASQRPRKNSQHLKGGLGNPSGGEQFGLKW